VILVLVAVVVIVILALLGPAIGNVFSAIIVVISRSCSLGPRGGGLQPPLPPYPVTS
jgi:hypothetical protein